ncbi:MAG: tetratricopeptide repeat protein [Janthinobacterium lividum]
MTGAELDALTPAEVEGLLSGPGRAAFLSGAAEIGIAEAQLVYGQMLLDGAGVERDERAALGWFVRAAGQGHVLALNMVGRCYDQGWGTRVDKARAAQAFRIAAERGSDWAMYNYATLLALGEGVAQDRAAALGWLERAAGLGNAKALNFVGSFHEDGWVVARDLRKAASCYARAANAGDFRAMFNHARMLTDAGRTGDALRWVARAGRAGNAAFVAKAAAWLARSPLGPAGVAAIRGEATAC